MLIPAFDDEVLRSAGLVVPQVEDGRPVDDDGPAGRPYPDVPADALMGPPDLAWFAWLNPALRDGASGPTLARPLELLDLTLALTPLRDDLRAWTAVRAGSFSGDWRDLPDTIQTDLGYLAVSLSGPPRVAPGEAVLHLAVPAGIPAAHLRPGDGGPAPVLLLARGLALHVQDARRDGGRWQVHAQVLPASNWGRQRDQAGRWSGDVVGAAGGR